jgi:hypothetical protein
MKKFFLNLYITIHSFFVNLGIAMKNTEDDILKPLDHDLDETKKHNRTAETKNPVLRKMQQGQKDEQYVNDFYEVLKKADSFVKNSSPSKFATSADKYGMNYGKKDRWGRRYEHYGFFDDQHKHSGKSLAEVYEIEKKERTTDDDEYPVEFMFSNIPESLGYLGNEQIIKNEKGELVSLTELEKKLNAKFPMRVERKREECFNRIEQLTEYVHVRKVGFDRVAIEFFIPAKFGLFNHDEDSEVFQEVIDIDMLWLKDEYSKLYGYKIVKYYKRVSLKYEDGTDIYHVVKLFGDKIKDI